MNPIPTPDQYQEIREALRDLCSNYDSNYWQKVDEARGYPEAFVNALTDAGWLAGRMTCEVGSKVERARV